MKITKVKFRSLPSLLPEALGPHERRVRGNVLQCGGVLEQLFRVFTCSLVDLLSCRLLDARLLQRLVRTIALGVVGGDILLGITSGPVSSVSPMPALANSKISWIDSCIFSRLLAAATPS